jgi:hypothetical protein
MFIAPPPYTLCVKSAGSREQEFIWAMLCGRVFYIRMPEGDEDAVLFADDNDAPDILNTDILISPNASAGEMYGKPETILAFQAPTDDIAKLFQTLIVRYLNEEARKQLDVVDATTLQRIL